MVEHDKSAGANQRVADTERLLRELVDAVAELNPGRSYLLFDLLNAALAQQAPAEQTPVCAEAIAYEQACLFILSLGYHWSDAEETWVKTASPVAEQRPETREEKK